MALSLARLRELLNYDPETGRFTWRVNGNNGIRKGAIAGCLDQTSGRFRICIDRKLHHASRLAVLWMTGEYPPQNVDHANCNPADNRWINLRPASQSQNLGNMRRPKHNTSGYKGVTWQAGKYIAKLGRRNFYLYLGRFDRAEDAHAAYVAAAKKYFGEFARAG